MFDAHSIFYSLLLLSADAKIEIAMFVWVNSLGLAESVYFFVNNSS